jgi:hypothetical protein
MGDERVTRVATVDLFDGSRGLMFHKGTYVEAPAEFFKRYDKVDLEAPRRAFNPATDFRMNIVEYIGMAEGNKPETVKVVAAAPVPGATATDKAPAMTSADAGALKGRGRRKKEE